MGRRGWIIFRCSCVEAATDVALIKRYNASDSRDRKTHSNPLLINTHRPTRPLPNRNARIENNILLRLRQILERSPLRNIDQPITPLVCRKSRIERNSRSDIGVRHVTSSVICAFVTLKPESSGIEDRVVGMVKAGAFVVVNGSSVGRAKDPVLGDGGIRTGG
jgi:hypothetical protein